MNYEIKPNLDAILAKLKKKDPVAFTAILKKIKEIVESGNPDHYKPLRYNLKNKKRVHITKSFVLVFEYESNTDIVFFLDYDHHDNIYSKH
ncbi:addiction module toxin RelE [Candidatus Woesearchaeota archaeon]|nr:addiction module toxin RelE [Candidatus Woesearchaeota archaeon]